MTREEALLSVTEADFKALCERWKTGYATPEDIELLRLFETSPSGGETPAMKRQAFRVIEGGNS